MGYEGDLELAMVPEHPLDASRMAASRIKGITVEIGGDTTKLKTAGDNISSVGTKLLPVTAAVNTI